jgi:autoinducer 2-degrading protein
MGVSNMLVALVHVRVKPESVEAFRKASLENARSSVQEPGVARFDVIQQENEPTRFVLIEVFRSAEGQAAHRETAHYKTWRETVESMMAEPRIGVRYRNVFPEDKKWEYQNADEI